MVKQSFSNNPMVLLGLAALSAVSGAVAAEAESMEPILVSAAESAESAPVHAESAIAIRPQPQLPQAVAPTFVEGNNRTATSVRPSTAQNPIDRQLLGAAATFSSPNPALLAQTRVPTAPSPLPTVGVTTAETESAMPAPGTSATSVEALQEPSEWTVQDLAPIDTVQLPIAQRRAPRRRRFNPADSYSYIGIGGNIGITESGDDDTTTTNGDDDRESPLGKGSFAINGKLGLGPSLSLRPSILVTDDLAFLIPLTYDFRIPTRDGVSPFIPFAGAGLVVTTTDDNHVGFLLSGGVDYRISPQWTANGSLNVGFLSDTTDIGVILGIAYTFPGFGFNF